MAERDRYLADRDAERVASLYGQPLGAFGTGSPAETSEQPSGLAAIARHAYEALGRTAQRAFGASEMMRQTGIYDPGPVLEAATVPTTGAVSGTTQLGTALGAGPLRGAMRPAIKGFTQGLDVPLSDIPGELAAGARAPMAHLPQDQIVNAIDRMATPEEKVRQLGLLTEQNKPLVNDFMQGIDRDLGTVSNDNVKKPENILSKASRPSVLASKPWHDVEHIRDSYRFKSVLDNIDNLPEINRRLANSGFEVIKRDTDKVLAPKEYGFPIAAYDLRAPNGQLIEYYTPLKEVEDAKNQGGHQLFEKWRNRKEADLTPAELVERAADQAESRRIYGEAMDRYRARTGQSDSDIRAALTKAAASPGSDILR